jgi:adenosylcobinamide-GDP ribazoletransferase
MRNELRAVAAAVAFLTRLPLPRSLALTGDDVARAGAWFPLVGASIGCLTGVVAWACAKALPAEIAAALAVAALGLLTGALHFDALADTADAAGGTTRERALEIMRDHAIGSYGALALVVDVVVRVTAIAFLVSHGDVVADLVVAGAVSRAAPVAVASVLPYARTSDGLGASLTRGSARRAVVAGVLALAIAAAVGHVTGLEILAAGAIVAVLTGAVWRRWLGGVTGDTLGATAELAELVGLVVAVAV